MLASMISPMFLIVLLARSSFRQPRSAAYE
jgi:hypothetical protein